MKLERVGNDHDIEVGLRPSLTISQQIIGRLQRGLRWLRRDVSKPIELNVHFAKDEETGRWYIAASDIPGLRVEADSPDELIRKVEEVAPDLIELNADEILERQKTLSQVATHHAKPSHRPVNIRPVFDSPMAVACH